ncbi:lipopolysaccharide biosynthesis protein [Simiduia agarivorans]|uniref:ATPase n=1 Tax=Simiduia agarivorans (strain DSM 21679 / JCM 13881 / BCRC 17597 / SA1) TaxID=1117647 RepID=K4KLK7_SIMAS|nr:lipopolysaccharide biosynthesis protein [Simiduia agarivorans]AFU98953.1 ATPase [Simiduia agarivorans SA1 = DSM 21679]
MAEMDLHKKLVSGFAWEAACKASAQVFSWISTIYVARVLAPADYGIVAISGIFVGLSLMLGGLGLCAGVIQKKGVTKAEMDGVFWLSMGLNGLVFGILFCLAPFIAKWYAIPMLTDVIRVAAFILLISGLSIIPRAIKLKELDFRFTSLAGMTGGFIITLTAFLLAWSGYGIWSLVVSTLAGELVLTVIYFYGSSWRPSFHYSWVEVKPIARFGVGLMMSRMVQFFNGKTSVIVSGGVLGEVSTGYLQFSETLARMPTDKIGGLFQSIAFASLSKVQDDVELSKNLLFRFHRYLVFVSYPILLGAAFVAEDLILIVLTDKWLPMKTALQLVCCVAAMSVSLLLLPRFLESIGRVNEVFKFQITLAVMSLIAMLVGAQWHLEGMILALLLVYPLLYIQILKYVLPRISSSIGEFLKSFIDVILVNVVFIVSLWCVSILYDELSPLLRLICAVASGGLIYGLLIIVFMRADIRALLEIIRKK